MKFKCLLFLLCLGVSLNAQCDREQDSLALVDFYNMANGMDWDTSWVLTQPMNTWYGVFLNNEGCVECLDLDGHANCEVDFLFSPTQYILNIYGDLPQSMENLTSLKSIIINRAGFGAFPTWITKLESLETIMFRSTQMIGIIPDDIDQLSNLKFLHLGGNNLSGEIPESIGNLTELEILFLFVNNFSGALPSSIGNLNKLERLILSFNNLEGTIPPEYANLESLTQLVVSDNSLTGNIPTEFETMKSLVSLEAGNNMLSGELPGHVALIDSIQYVVLENNQYYGCIPEEITNSCETITYELEGHPLLAYTGDIYFICESGPDDIVFCDDGYAGTSNDAIQDDCSCKGELDPLECLCDIVGIYDAETSLDETGPFSGCLDASWMGTLEIRSDGNDGFLIYTTSPNGEELDDASFGAYYACYGTDSQAGLPNNGYNTFDYLRLKLECDSIYFEGESQWGENYAVNSYSFDNDVFSMEIVNSYGEAWSTIMTKQSGEGFPNQNICYLDEDGDGYTTEFDCNDIDPTINPDAIEILDNGIDEDCSGADLSSVLDLNDVIISLYPNPSSDYLNIEFDDFDDLEIKMYSGNGTFVQQIANRQTDISQMAEGLYFVLIKSKESGQTVTAKIVKQ